eukprot:8316623-Pyramimonas_sp.AAC.1
MLQGEPRESARQTRIQQDVYQQKLEKSKSKFERAQNALVQAMQAAAQAKEEMAAAQLLQMPRLLGPPRLSVASCLSSRPRARPPSMRGLKAHAAQAPPQKRGQTRR